MATFTVFALEAAAPLSVPAAGVGSGGGSAPPAAPVTGQPVSGTAAREPIRWWVAVGALVVFAVAAIVAWFMWDSLKPADRPVFVPSSDYSALAGLLLSAAAIERLLEPLSPWLLSKKQEKDDEAKAVKTATDLAEDPAVPADEVKAAVQVAAVAKAVVSRKESERAVAHWAVASVLALIVPAVLGVFLRSVSTGSAPNAFVDMAFTALIVGAGTKPLHETISFIQAKKKTAEAAADKA